MGISDGQMGYGHLFADRPSGGLWAYAETYFTHMSISRSQSKLWNTTISLSLLTRLILIHVCRRLIPES